VTVGEELFLGVVVKVVVEVEVLRVESLGSICRARATQSWTMLITVSANCPKSYPSETGRYATAKLPRYL
jgi:hypothetical protein